MYQAGNCCGVHCRGVGAPAAQEGVEARGRDAGRVFLPDVPESLRIGLRGAVDLLAI
jgi:hypothetical protein